MLLFLAALSRARASVVLVVMTLSPFCTAVGDRHELLRHVHIIEHILFVYFGLPILFVLFWSDLKFSIAYGADWQL
jgi:hypothetical protein